MAPIEQLAPGFVELLVVGHTVPEPALHPPHRGTVRAQCFCLARLHMWGGLFCRERYTMPRKAIMVSVKVPATAGSGRGVRGRGPKLDFAKDLLGKAVQSEHVQGNAKDLAVTAAQALWKKVAGGAVKLPGAGRRRRR